MVATWTQVGPPVVLATLEPTTFTEPSVVASTDLVVEPPGQLNPVALAFRAGLYAAISRPRSVVLAASSWATSVWVLPDPVRVGAGVGPSGARRVAGGTDGLTYELVDSGAG